MGQWLFVVGLYFFGAVEASFDHVGANAWPLHSENAKICYQMHENKTFGSINCR